MQGYISPPIAACFILGILWPRLNARARSRSLLTGFVMGAARFMLEVLDRPRTARRRRLRWLVDMNFLHYAILMFVVCSAVLIGVSLVTPALPAKLAGLTFATVDEKMESTPVSAHAVPKETRRSSAECCVHGRPDCNGESGYGSTFDSGFESCVGCGPCPRSRNSRRSTRSGDMTLSG